jgi:hypothetical protein
MHTGGESSERFQPGACAFYLHKDWILLALPGLAVWPSGDGCFDEGVSSPAGRFWYGALWSTKHRKVCGKIYLHEETIIAACRVMTTMEVQFPRSTAMRCGAELAGTWRNCCAGLHPDTFDDRPSIDDSLSVRDGRCHCQERQRLAWVVLTNSFVTRGSFGR